MALASLVDLLLAATTADAHVPTPQVELDEHLVLVEQGDLLVLLHHRDLQLLRPTSGGGQLGEDGPQATADGAGAAVDDALVELA